jgi:hypothetical protein
MATRDYRLSEFNQGPPPDRAVEVLCEDHNGTYVLPYLCNWKDGGWHHSASGTDIEATVVGWR